MRPQHKQQRQPKHHVQCSYEKDQIDTQQHSTQQQQQQNYHQNQQQLLQQQKRPSHQKQHQQQPHDDHQHSTHQQQSHCHAYTYDEPHPQTHTLRQQQASTGQQPRKHSYSHSPHPSRHTSPHEHRSQSLHSSPHQSHQRVYDTAGKPESPARSQHHQLQARSATATSSARAHHHNAHSHGNSRRRRRHHSHQHGSDSGGGSGGGHQSSMSATVAQNGHQGSCSRRHRSATDISRPSTNTYHDPLCADREIQDILVRKSCCSSSRTELAQYFAEDLYGSARRPPSCCNSSDYCYQTDSTSLYGSRSSLSRNNSIKSASVALRKRRLHQRQPSYSSISLRGLNTDGRLNNQTGSLTSIFERAKQLGATGTCGSATSGKLLVSPSEVTIERHTSKDALSNDLPEYACSPSPIRWSFLADGLSPTELEDTSAGGGGGGGVGGGGGSNSGYLKSGSGPWTVVEAVREPKNEYGERGRCSSNGQQTQLHSYKTSASTSTLALAFDERPSTSTAAARKCRESPFSCDFEQSTTVLFHQEGEAFNNCCSNYIQCNTYLDHDLQITSEDIHQYLSKGNLQAGDVLNNSKNYPFQPSNALEFQYKNNFAANNNNNNYNSNNNSNHNTNTAASSDGGDSARGYDGHFQRNSKETNLNQNAIAAVTGAGAGGGCAASSSSSDSTPLPPTNINLSSSTNNINIVFQSGGGGGGGCVERNANEVKFINTARDGNVVSAEAHHSGYLPYTYPTYDYTNMSANSLFDKPIVVDELSRDHLMDGAVLDGGRHLSRMQSPLPDGASIESFDAASEHNLLSHRGSCQFSSIATSGSPLSPPASSCLLAFINPPIASCIQTHHPHYGATVHDGVADEDKAESGSRSYGVDGSCARRSFHGRDHHHASNLSSHHHLNYSHSHASHHHHHFTESFKFGNAFRKVRKRARKYTDFLRKK